MSMFDTVRRLQSDNKRLRAENIKLRKLLLELMHDPDAWDYDYFTWRIEKMGIEVD